MKGLNMPALPWSTRTQAQPDQHCVVMASRLPLVHYRHIPAFLRQTMAIRRQLGGTDGLIGYALDANLLHKTFWTVSAWSDRDALAAFNRADPHRGAVTAIRPAMATTTFVTWTCDGSDLPIRWEEVRRRINESDSKPSAG
jgi:hypothetical protein